MHTPPIKISIHALLAESDPEAPVLDALSKEISIHALLAESDFVQNYNTGVGTFLSTLSLRRATRLGLLGWLRTLISIHALLAESDVCMTLTLRYCEYFYPRSPCGERPWADTDYNISDIISIHALLAESDRRGAILVILII